LQPYNVKPLLRRMAKALAFAEQSRATDRIAVVEEAAQHMLDAWDANNQDDMEAALTNIRSALAGQPLTYQTIAEIRALSKEHNHVEG
jgi:predicted GTPase